MQQWEDYDRAKQHKFSTPTDDSLSLVASFIDWLDTVVGADDELAYAFRDWANDSYLNSEEAQALVKAADWMMANGSVPPPDGRPNGDPLGTVARYLARPEFRDVLRRSGRAANRARTVIADVLTGGESPSPEELAEVHRLYVWATQEAPARQRELAEKRARLGQLQQEIDSLRRELGE